MTPKTLTFAVVLAAFASTAAADTSPEDFTFSDDLTTSFTDHTTDVETFNATVTAAIEGLSDDEVTAVFESYADEAEALRETGKALREEGAAEIEAAGLTPTNEREERGDRPNRATSTDDSDDDSSDDSSDDDASADDSEDRPTRPAHGPRPPKGDRG